MDEKTIYFDKNLAKQYDGDRYGGSFGRFLHDLEVSAFMSLMDSSYKSVLDVGAGTGKLFIPLASKFERVVAADFSSEMVKIAFRKGAESAKKLNIIVCDTHRLCFKDKAFDCVVSSRLLMHLNDWRKGIAEICRVSKRDVILDFPPKVSFGFLDSLLKQFLFHKRTYRTFLLRDVAKELQNNNFKMVKLTKQLFLPFAFHRILNRPRLTSKMENFFSKTGLIRFMGSTAIGKAVRTDS